MSDNTSSPRSKRPYATLDLRATEIKVTPIGDTFANIEPEMPPIGPVPWPAPARTFATPAAAAAETVKASATTASSAQSAKPTASAASPSGASKSDASKSDASKSGAPKSGAPEKVKATIVNRYATEQQGQTVVQKRGGFFSHLAAGIIGGGVALGAWTWGLPELSGRGYIPFALSGDAGLTQRLAKLEKAQAGGDLAAKLDRTEARLADVEKSAAKIGDIKEAQTRFVAETKATLAAAAGDSGATEQLTRIAALEAKLKAMTEAGASDPNAGRMEQLAALTGRLADLETSLATQHTALRKSVAGDVEARLTAATEASEAAKSGTQRIERDIATAKSEAASVGERMAAIKSDGERTADTLKRTQSELASLKSSIETLTASVAKPADITAAVSPVTAKIAALETDLKSVQQAEAERRSNAERVVLALELQNLKRALDRGQKYDGEFAQVEKVAGGAIDLAPLAKFKDQGVPTVAELTKEFRPSVNAMIDAETIPADGSVVDRMIAGAKAVVRVRKVSHDPNDNSAEAVAGRMEAALKEGRLNDVVAEAGDLSPKAKDAAAPFLEKVSARASVDKALASLEDKLKSSMSGTPASPASPAKTQ